MKRRNYKDWIDAYVQYVSETEPPESYKYWMGLTAISAALQRKCCLPWGLDIIYPNIYVILVGPPGARKGTAMKPAGELIEKAGIHLAPSSASFQGMIQEFVELDGISYGASDMNMHRSLTIFSEELLVFIGKGEQGLMAALTDWYDCRDTFKYKTVGRGTETIDNVYLTLAGATTPELIRTDLSPNVIGGGFTSRVIFVIEEKKSKLVPFNTITPEMKERKEKLIQDLQMIYAMQGKFTVTQEFIEAYTEWYTRHDANPVHPNNKNLDGYNNRRQTHLRKLAMLCNASRTTTMNIELVDFIRALNILEETEKKMGNLFLSVQESTYRAVAIQLFEFCKARLKFSEADLYQEFGYVINEWNLKQMISAMVKADQLQELHKGDGTVTYVYTGGE